MNNNHNITIRKMETDIDKMLISLFLYDQLVANLGVRNNAADHKRRILENEHLSGIVYMVYSGNTLVGSLRINDFSDGIPKECLENFDVLSYNDKVSEFGAFVTNSIIHPQYCNSEVYAALATNIVREAIYRGVQVLFNSTAFGRHIGAEEEYLKMCQSCGLQIWKSSIDVPDVGKGSILVLDILKEISQTGSVLNTVFTSTAS